MTSSIVIIVAAFYGMVAVILGAFGAHYLKKKWSEEHLVSLETGIRYQFIHALLLLILGFQAPLNSSLEKLTVLSIMIGVFLFSFSIYGLCYSANKGKKWRFLGPITPLGGLLMILGWLGIIIQFC